MAFSQDFLKELIERVDLVGLISEQVRLKASGSNWSACCPFHQEKTPSFTVSPQKGFFHCFGCHAHGNALDFVMKQRGCNFPEAVRLLADWAGMVCPETPPQALQAEESKEKRAFLKKALGEAVAFYEASLWSPEQKRVLHYLTGTRGLTKETIRSFRVGFCSEARPLMRHPKAELYKSAWLELGLLVSLGGAKLQERFRDRILFPIQDRRGDWIALGGRALGSQMPKYLNSPENLIFRKSHSLYKQPEVKRQGVFQPSGKRVAFLVEGYIDVMAMTQLGYSEVCATLGTAISESQVRQLFSNYEEIFLGYDGDRAGQKAYRTFLERALPLLKGEIALNFITWPEGADPASLLAEGSTEALASSVQQATPFSQWFFRWLLQEEEEALESVEGRARFANRVRHWLALLTDKELKFQLEQVASSYLGQRFPWSAALPNHGIDQGSGAQGQGRSTPSNLEPLREKRFLIPVALLLQEPWLAGTVALTEEFLEALPHAFRELLSALMQQAKKQGSDPLAVRLEGWRSSPYYEWILRAAALEYPVEAGEEERVFKEALERLMQQKAQVGLNRLLAQAKQRVLTLEEQRLYLEQLRKVKGLSDVIEQE